MKKLAALLALFCMTAVMSQAATTIVLTHSGVDTTYTDLQTAKTAMVPGDTLDIQAFDGPMSWNNDGATNWSTVKCTAATPAHIMVTGNMMGVLDHTTLTNLIIDGGGVCASAHNGGTASTVTNCVYKGFTWHAIFIANGSKTGGVQDAGATFNNCYLISGGGDVIGLQNNFISASATVTNKLTLNHCTLVSTGNWPISVDTSYNTASAADLSTIMSIHNCIISARTAVRAIIFNGTVPAGTVLDEDYNIFDAWWSPFWCATGSIAIGPHSFKYDFRTIDATHPDPYRNYAGADYRLNTATPNPAVGFCADFSNAGADQSVAPAAKIVLTHANVAHNYTDMTSANAAMAAGDTLDIQDFSGPLPWPKTCPSWSTVKCTKAGAQATLLTSKDGFGGLDHMTLQNLIIDGQCVGKTHFLADGVTAGAASLASGGASSNVTNCTFKGAWWNLIMPSTGTMTGGVQDPGTTFTNCYFISGGGSCFAFTDSWVTAPATITNKFIINHCTLVGVNDGPAIELDGTSYAGKDLKNVFSLHNSIVSGRKTAVGINYHGGILLTPATQVDEDYNVFDSWWHPLYSEGNDSGMSDHVGANSVKVDYRTFVNTAMATHDFYQNYAAGDYSLYVCKGSNWGPNMCIKTASDGGNIGADSRALVPVELSSFSAE